VSEDKEKMDSKASNRLGDLLNYVHHVGQLNQKPIFSIEEYKQLNIWEHELKGKIGIQHNVIHDDGIAIWLRVERLKRLAPPPIPEHIKEWVSVGNDPENTPQIKNKVIKTLSEQEANTLIEQGIVVESDVTDPLKEQTSGIKLKDVIFRLGNNQLIKTDIDNYVNEQWLAWSEEEKPRRATIKIYDSLFSLQQTIEAQGDEQPIELIWGIGISRWICKKRKINHPLLEKPIEIEVDRKDGAILIHPRNNEPTIAVGAYFALENSGVDALLRFGKKYFSEMSEDIEFSPYIHESFEPILRQASTHLSESGTYWPDINPDKENREPNKISDSLEISDSWVLFARPRSTTGFIQDIKRFQKILEESKTPDHPIPNPIMRFVTELSNKKPIQADAGFLSGSGLSASSSGISPAKKQKTELFFPKAFNDSQVQIIDRLEENDGVVVQGPPGTGKTHTIANIICHYLATGRRVLVTSKGEPALSVLQSQIPDELRALTISLLANERQGMKQLEAAVEFLAGLVSQTNLGELNQEAASNASRVKQLKREINEIDERIKDWGLKQLNSVGQKLTGENNDMTAMELARLVMDDAGTYGWFTDELGSSERFTPKFTDSDIATIRMARRKVGKDICYVGKSIPQIQNLPDSANIAAIHNDLCMSAKIDNDSKSTNVPPLAVSVEKSVERAKQLIQPLQDLGNLLDTFQNNAWLNKLFVVWIEAASPSNSESVLFDELVRSLDDLTERRQLFVKTLVEIPDPYECLESTQVALTNLANNKKAFGIFSFGNKEAKNLIERAKVEGELPKDAKTWQLVLDYVTYQYNVRKFIVKWNHAGQELELPEFVYQYGSLHKDIQVVQKTIAHAKHTAEKWRSIKQEISTLFPHGIDVPKITQSKLEIDKLIKTIELNTSRISLGAQRIKLEGLMEQLKQSDGDIANRISHFLKTAIGNAEYSSDKIIQHWQEWISELNRINELTVHLNDIESIAALVSDSGAPIWAGKLKSEPLLEEDDTLTPVDWYETWRWSQRKQYLHEIDGRSHLKKLSQKRAALDNDLKRTFSKLVRIKTNIGLHMSMTERVQSALTRFVSSIAKMGKGTGKRAPRYRRDAYRAMQDCYSGVPCWIMPTWRVNENLPSDFGSFDLVIIDEASQSDITALPAILRAKKLLIVGDDKQVSPTAAFLAEEKILQLKHNFLREQPFAELLLPGMSIYDLANAVFPSQRIMLTEHFRCVEPIIRFSMQFYNEPLIPLRIPKSSEKLTPPLIDVYVKEGLRDGRRKVNEIEAAGIISEIKTLVANPKFKGRSIGVISLIGAQQAKYIQDQLLIELGEAVFQNYKIACGDAATFQGKERDIVFLSMVVGARQGVTMSKRDAEQRMNVALSRARDRMYLYRSLQESDLSNESDLRLKILKHFSSPMEQLKQVNNPIDLCDSGFERDVYKRLTAKGYNVVPQVKVGAFSIDLVVEGENDQRLAIELDGDKYHPPEQWMNDWKRQRTMERVGWQFWRCWGSSYTIDPEGCIDDLINVLNNMQIFPCESSSGSNIYTEQRIYEEKREVENNGLDF